MTKAFDDTSMLDLKGSLQTFARSMVAIEAMDHPEINVGKKYQESTAKLISPSWVNDLSVGEIAVIASFLLITAINQLNLEEPKMDKPMEPV